MALISYVPDDTDSAEAKVLFEHLEILLGRVANAMRVAAHSPKVAQPLAGFLIAALREQISGILPLRIKAVVILKTSFLNGCAYCVGTIRRWAAPSASPTRRSPPWRATSAVPASSRPPKGRQLPGRNI